MNSTIPGFWEGRRLRTGKGDLLVLVSRKLLRPLELIRQLARCEPFLEPALTSVARS